MTVSLTLQALTRMTRMISQEWSVCYVVHFFTMCETMINDDAKKKIERRKKRKRILFCCFVFGVWDSAGLLVSTPASFSAVLVIFTVVSSSSLLLSTTFRRTTRVSYFLNCFREPLKSIVNTITRQRVTRCNVPWFVHNFIKLHQSHALNWCQ